VSNRINRDPSPRGIPRRHLALRWPVLQRIKTFPIIPPPAMTFPDLVEARRSVRKIGPIPLRDVLNYVAFATYARFELVDDNLGRTQRPAMSAGALHPIDVLVISGLKSPHVFRCDAEHHQVERLRVSNPEALKQFLAKAYALLPEAEGSFLALVADSDKTQAVYRDCVSLIWRDAGALLQTLNLCAIAYGMGFCAMGILGQELIEALFTRDCSAIAVGAACVGVGRN
jgi:hypothetical protein